MGGGDRKEVKNEINQEQGRVQGQYDRLYNDMEAKRDEFSTRSNEERDYLTNSLRGINDSGTGGLDSNVIGNIRGLYGGKSVGMDDAAGGGTNGGFSGNSGSIGGTVAGDQGSQFDKAERKWDHLADTGGVEIDKLRAQIPELENMAKTGAFDPRTKSEIDAIVTQLKNFQYDPQAASSIQNSINGLKSIAADGGYNPEALARIRGDIEALRNAAQTGGIDAGQLNKLRGGYEFMMDGGMSADDQARFRGTGFDEFAQTGGWSPEQQAEFRNRSTSVIPSMYAQGQNEAQRMAAIGGGSPAAMAAAQSRATRQGSQDLATASRNAEVDLQTNIRDGRQWGITGQRDTEEMLQSQLGTNRATGLASGNQLELGVGTNKLSGLEGALKGETNLEQNIAANKIGAGTAAGNMEIDFQNSVNDAVQKSLSGAGNLMANVETAISANRVKAQEAASQAEARAQQLQQEGLIAGAQGLTQIAAQKASEARAASSAAGSARAADQANERWWAQFISSQEQFIGQSGQQGQQNALRNLTQIYGMDPTLPRDSMQVDIAGQQAGANARLLGIDAQNAQGGRDWMDWARFGIGAGGAAMDTWGSRNQDMNMDWASGADPRGNIWDHNTVPGGMNPGQPQFPDPEGRGQKPN